MLGLLVVAMCMAAVGFATYGRDAASTPMRHASIADHGQTAGLLPRSFKTLRFDVCNGFTNQRLSLMYGVVAAVRSGRAVVVPRVVTDGRTGSEGGSEKREFADMYDEEHFKREMRKASVLVVSESVAPPLHEYLDIGSVDHLQQFAVVDHASVPCPLFKLQIQPHEYELFWAVMDALVPAPWAQVGRGELRRRGEGAHGPCQITRLAWATVCMGHARSPCPLPQALVHHTRS
jgi:hypothetical protein